MKHERKPLRLEGYDYTNPGLYFVTVCCYDRQHLFGKIANQKMILNDAGKMANFYWLNIQNHYQNIVLHEHVVMPNHIHGIIEIKESDSYRITLLGSVIKGFKIGVTKWMRKHTNAHRVWQRSYYEHIIRDGISYGKIAQYILLNPENWNDDKFYSE